MLNPTELEQFKDFEERYEREGAWGMLTSLDLHGCNPAIIRSAEKIKEFTVKLCEMIKVKRFQEAVIVDFGEDERVSGFSLVQLIETSLVSGHFANQTNSVYIDIFSCKYYDPKVAAEFTKEFFEAKDFTFHLTLRK